LSLFSNEKRFEEFSYDNNESDFENTVVSEAKIFFGSSAVYLDTKRRIDTESLGGAVPDGVLFDLGDTENPTFYLVEIELSNHDFNRHILPQITKFFAFLRKKSKQENLVKKLFEAINTDQGLRKEFKDHLGEQELFVFVKNAVERGKILLIIDAEKPEVHEVMETSPETWGMLVKMLILKEFRSGSEKIYSTEPDFSLIGPGPGSPSKSERSGSKYIPGKSCPQLGMTHNFVQSRTGKTWRCTRCNSVHGDRASKKARQEQDQRERE
jgi:hypothetical protein